ncbi:hypothetical protein L202_00579 [Cryptococcus amylolentus CBS 6039]|uniref:Zn(2)-C6 fungal-type domain-containing protein n=1 Tax=Cryptococcus amylolentus CBS 6039 TaxID=1295533 RepID=A0A1E3I7K1_9TREE|nr:hypothetical protein L202_00579 [Cryptococcus amylolentus CBS 6039]ODN84683.1 hypothetical protein L202_00579 [Cryptococcus amylolentus CBS 6039]
MPIYSHDDLSTYPPLNGVVLIDTSEPEPPPAQNPADVANVLRRNQACRQCRRRKLKCDAARPHCATCIRSYRHLLKTSPRSNPILCCDYDDGAPAQSTEHDTNKSLNQSTGQAAPTTSFDNNADDEGTQGNGGSKKKRKASGEGKRKKKEDEFQEEKDRLNKKIQELQSQLSKKSNGTQQPPTPPASRGWSGSSSLFANQDQSAPSPNTFLDMFTTGPAAQHAADSQTTSNTMWSNSASLDSGNLAQTAAGLANIGQSLVFPLGPSPPNQTGSHGSSGRDDTPNLTESSSGQNTLSPGDLFNFPSPDTTSAARTHAPGELPYPFSNPVAFDSDVKDSWQGLPSGPGDSASFTASSNTNNGHTAAADVSMGGEINLDGLQASLDAAMQQQILMDMFWPGWPAKLPEPNIVNELVDAFDNVPNLPRMLHRARFLSRLALPPTHANFPHPSLVHAICASAAAWCDPSVYEKSTRDKQWANYGMDGSGLWGPEGKPTKKASSFGARQTLFAKEAVQEGLNTGNRLFDVVRAMIILCRVFIDDTRMLECWAYGGLVARMILPLGLNVRSAELSLKSVMLPPAQDALEREERRAAMWMAFYHDTIASAASGWGTSISLEELTVPLPVSKKDFDAGNEYMEPNPQDIESPDLFLRHPVPDSFVMVTKASILMNRTNRFVRRWKNRNLKPNDDLEGMERPEFKELANSIACFQMSFPPSLRNYSKLGPKKQLDIDLIAAHMLPFAATICLYEPFADLDDPSDQPTRRLVAATQGIVGIVQQLASAAGGEGDKFASIMHSSASVCFVTTARTSLLLMRHAMNNNDAVSAESHKMDCEMVRLALAHFGTRFKIGQHHAQLIEYFLDRACNPTFEKLSAHYPDHPRPGAPELTRESDFGWCISNALNVKRGFWRAVNLSTSTSPPDSNSSSDPHSFASHSYPNFSQTQTYIAVEQMEKEMLVQQGQHQVRTVSGDSQGATLKDISMESSPGESSTSGSGGQGGDEKQEHVLHKGLGHNSSVGDFGPMTANGVPLPDILLRRRSEEEGLGDKVASVNRAFGGGFWIGPKTSS